jgi:hypothetical protein
VYQGTESEALSEGRQISLLAPREVKSAAQTPDFGTLFPWSRISMGSISRDLYTPSPVNSGADPALPPALYLICHGQAEHNVNPSQVSRRDTILTPTGQLQAADLRTTLPASSRFQIGAVVASPLRRALQTALIGFEDLIILDNSAVANRVSVNTTVLGAG